MIVRADEHNVMQAGKTNSKLRNYEANGRWLGRLPKSTLGHGRTRKVSVVDERMLQVSQYSGIVKEENMTNNVEKNNA